MILNWNIPFLAKLLPNAYFIHIIRDIRFNAQSLLVSRKNFFGDTKEWYSFKPPEYPGLSGLTPEEQVVHQVNYTNLAIKKGISSLLPEKVITIKYEELCETPEDTLKKIVNQVLSKSTPHEEQFQGQLTNGNKVALPFATWDKIEHVANQLM